MNSYLRLIFLNLLLLLAISNTLAQVVDTDSVSTTQTTNILSGVEIPDVNYSQPQ